MIEQLLQNDVFVGVVGAGGMGMVAFWTRNLWKTVSFTALRAFSVELEVRNDDRTYHWLTQWLSQTKYAKRARRLRLSVAQTNEDSIYDEVASDDRVVLTPGFGLHWFWHRGRLIWLLRSEIGDKTTGMRVLPEKIVLRTVGRDQAILTSIVDEAHQITKKVEGIQTFLFDQHWNNMGLLQDRDVGTVVLHQGQKDRIIADAEWFFGARSWYQARGIPYRRGYLFYGPPGTGKTSFVIALASYFKRPIYVLNLNGINGDAGLASALSYVNPKAILLIEDVDAVNRLKATKKRKSDDGDDEDEEDSRISTSGLLNAIDGVVATTGRLLIMTTNHPEKLDPALIRAGRIDLREEFNLAGYEEAWRLFKLFYVDADEWQDLFKESWPWHEGLSPAALQGVFMKHSSDPASAIMELKCIAEER